MLHQKGISPTIKLNPIDDLLNIHKKTTIFFFV